MSEGPNHFPTHELATKCTQSRIGKRLALIWHVLRPIEEVRDVLVRPRIRAKNPAITDDSVAAFCRRVEQVALRIDPVPALLTLARDPDDEPYLNLAIAVSGDYLVTRDNDMLDLMQDPAFRARYPTLMILDPMALLQRLNPSAPAP